MSADRTRLPSFLVIGAMKAGTTSLYHYLRHHPQVFMPRIKELDFFAGEGNWRRGLGWYTRQFAEAGPGAIAIGEASTTYSKYPRYQGVAERIAQHVPHALLVYVVRNPIDRIRSHYQHRVAVGAETEPMESALIENPIYLDYSRYAMQIDQYVSHFPRERLLIVTSEDLRHDRLRTIGHVYAFLGVDPDWVPPTLDREFYRTEGRPIYPSALWPVRRTIRRWFPAAKRAKELVDSFRLGVSEDHGRGSAVTTAIGSSARAEIPPGLRRLLEDHLRDDIRRLHAYLGPSFDGWGIS